MNYLPNKKFIFFCFVCLLVVGGVFFVSDYFPKNNNSSVKNAVRDLIVKTQSPDSEKLDIQEIKNGYDPRLEETNIALDNSAEEEKNSEKYSLTDIFGQKFLSEYILLKQKSGENLTQEDKQSIIDYMLKGAQTLENENQKLFYSLKDIKISKGTDKNSVKNYGNNLALIIKKYFDRIPESEITVISNAFKNEDERSLAKLTEISDAYRRSAQEMLSLETPENFSESHLSLINNFENISAETKNMKEFFSDPLRSILAIKQYQTDATNARKILEYINTYFVNNEIAFTNSEPANFFKAYLQ